MFSVEMQYMVIRYMFNDLGDEAANVGIVAAMDNPFRVFYRTLDDPGKKSRRDARVNRRLVEAFALRARTVIDDYSVKATGPESRSLLLEHLQELSVGRVRLSMPRTVLTNDPDAEFEILFDQWVAPRLEVQAPRQSGRKDPYGKLRRQASRALVSSFKEGFQPSLKKQPFAVDYEVQGTSSHRAVFDLAIFTGANGGRTELLFHHLLVLPESEDTYTQAEALCWRWSDVRTDRRALTAVLYKHSKEYEDVPEARSLLSKESVIVINLAELPAMAKTLSKQVTMF